MGAEERETVDGALMVGAEGEVYFIPNKELEAYRVSDDLGEAARGSVPQPEVEGYVQFSTAAGNIRQMAAYHGPVGWRPVSEASGIEKLGGFVDFGLGR